MTTLPSSFCVCVCWSEVYQPYSTLEAGPTENRFPADGLGAAWGRLCVFVIWVSSQYRGSGGWECTDAVGACSDTCTLPAMSDLSRLAANVCVSSMTNIVVARPSCDLDRLYPPRWEEAGIQSLGVSLAINFLREAL